MGGKTEIVFFFSSIGPIKQGIPWQKYITSKEIISQNKVFWCIGTSNVCSYRLRQEN
uniref:Uncharacterized protein n=1 Tax=Solanum tuberosum TaxID=4113 RepID=M1ANC2_SOLTU